jgi:hypothetical protein
MYNKNQQKEINSLSQQVKINNYLLPIIINKILVISLIVMNILSVNSILKEKLTYQHKRINKT